MWNRNRVGGGQFAKFQTWELLDWTRHVETREWNWQLSSVPEGITLIRYSREFVSGLRFAERNAQQGCGLISGMCAMPCKKRTLNNF
jgi:hypothetical protein